MLSLLIFIYIFSIFIKKENSKLVLRVALIHLVGTLLFIALAMYSLPGGGVTVQCIFFGADLHVTFRMLLLQFISLTIASVKLGISIYYDRETGPSISNYFLMQLLKMMDFSQIPLLGYFLACIYELTGISVCHVSSGEDI